MRKRSLALAALAVAVMAAPQALAFGTIRAAGQNAEHERITRDGLRSFNFGGDSLNELAGKNGTWGAVGAPDNPTRGLMGSHAAHCDGGDFFANGKYPQNQAKAAEVLTSCRTYIYKAIDEAVKDAAGLVKPNGQLDSTSIWGGCTFNGSKGRAKCNVFEDMGMAFHAAQDFYSHSNWIDAPRASPSLTNPPGLNNTASAPWLASNNAPFPAGLISGCYDGFPESLHCSDRIRHAVLNKDTAGTERGTADYNRAMAVAAQDTQAKWAYFESRLVAVYGASRGNKMACVLKRDKPETC
jgi:hypothetical protein